MQRFIGKRISNKVVRPMCNVNKAHKVTETIIPVKKNKEEKIEKPMNDKIEQAAQILSGERVPKRKVKVEKKEKGLFERAENDITILTEDNKTLLND